MNKHESDILELLLKDSKLTQRQISESNVTANVL